MQFNKVDGGGWSIAIMRDGTFFGMIHPRSFLETVVRGGRGKLALKKVPSLQVIAARLGKKLLDKQAKER